MTDHQQKQVSENRISYWGRSYLDSTLESFNRAEQFYQRQDFFTAYMYLFVSFNNLYCLLAGFADTEPAKIRAALKDLPERKITGFYTADYVRLINCLNDGPPLQFLQGPDSGSSEQGILNMRDYFLGKETAQRVVHVSKVSLPTAPAADKKHTLQEVAACLLYTIRNNQFHAVKGAQNLADQRTLETAYRLLLPIVEALIPRADRYVNMLRRSYDR